MCHLGKDFYYCLYKEVISLINLSCCWFDFILMSYIMFMCALYSLLLNKYFCTLLCLITPTVFAVKLQNLKFVMYIVRQWPKSRLVEKRTQMYKVCKADKF